MDENNAFGAAPANAANMDSESFKVAVKVKPNNLETASSPAINNPLISPATAPAVPEFPTSIPEVPDKSPVDTASTNPTFNLSDLANNTDSAAAGSVTPAPITEPKLPDFAAVPDAGKFASTTENTSGIIMPATNAIENPSIQTPLTELAVSPEPVNPSAPMPEQTATPNKIARPKKSKKMLIILTVILFVAIIAGAAYYFFVYKKSATTTGNNSSNTANSTAQKLTASDVAGVAALIDKDLAIQNSNTDISGTDLSDTSLGL